MRSEQTTIVVGAGASAEVGLPIGRKLVEDVVHLLDFTGRTREQAGDRAILDLFTNAEANREITANLDASLRVREGIVYSNSIDSFIDIHRDDVRMKWCGKLAITQATLSAERQSALTIVRNGGSADPEVVNNSWFAKLMRYMTDGVRKTELDRVFDKVSFIVFNYDRCIEHFLYHALQKLYAIEETHSAALLSKLRIYHAYGTIADLPWQNPTHGVGFGFPTNSENLQLMSDRIRTFTEQIADDSLQTTIHDRISNAETLLFLGFSFHEQNMQLIRPSSECQAKQVLGTAFGISESNV